MTLQTKFILCAIMALFITAFANVANIFTHDALKSTLQRVSAGHELKRLNADLEMIHDLAKADISFAIQAYEAGLVIDAREIELRVAQYSDKLGTLIHEAKALETQAELPLTTMQPVHLNIQTYISKLNGVLHTLEYEHEPMSAVNPFFAMHEEVEQAIQKASHTLGGFIEAEQMELTRLQHVITFTTFMESAFNILIILVLAYVGTWRMIFPIKKMIGKMTQLSKGNHHIEITGVRRQDEIGEAARALDVFKEQAIKVAELNQRIAVQDDQQQRETQSQIEHLAYSLDEAVHNIISMIQSESTTILEHSEEIRQMANHSAENSQTLDRSAALSRQVSILAEDMCGQIDDLYCRVKVLLMKGINGQRKYPSYTFSNLHCELFLEGQTKSLDLIDVSEKGVLLHGTGDENYTVGSAGSLRISGFPDTLRVQMAGSNKNQLRLLLKIPKQVGGDLLRITRGYQEKQAA